MRTEHTLGLLRDAQFALELAEDMLESGDDNIRERIPISLQRARELIRCAMAEVQWDVKATREGLL